ncbi:MAG: hypothetical protein EKK40_13750 [Bradyrhizobiaceae bacterium]|nr:MAG: hypothetical protein EKK40_13750 [Bradyrhizobiaceae bacterium]
MTLRLQKIDENNRRDHFYLQEEDECFYIYEYTAGAGWRGGETNQLIHNLQKKQGDGGYNYKAPAIVKCASALSQTINADWLSDACLVPVPPSKIKTDAEYDDRIFRVCRAIRKPNEPDVRELIEQINSTEKFKGGNRKKPTELMENYRLVEGHFESLPKAIGVVDDLLTTGSHFRAVKDKILERAPNTRVVGFFIARRALPNPFDDVSLEELLA